MAWLLLSLAGLSWAANLDDWHFVGNGYCRPDTCDSCRHPWDERSVVTSSLSYCLAFAQFGVVWPSISGFRVLRSDETYSWDGLHYRRDSLSLDEAAEECAEGSDCKGFAFNFYTGRVNVMYGQESNIFQCCSYEQHCWCDPQDTYCIAEGLARPSGCFGCCSGTDYLGEAYEIYYTKDGTAFSENLRPTPKAMYFHEASRECVVYDENDSDESALPAFGGDISQPSAQRGQCYTYIVAARDAAKKDGPSVSLSDADGQALEVQELQTSVAMKGPFALVAVHYKLRNPRQETAEGRFSTILPPRSSVQRLAMMIDGSWMEGEVVERSKARRIWRELLLQRRDPALLEQAQGNVFAAKIFPIWGGATVELKLTYSTQVLAQNDVRRLVVPFIGLPFVTILETKLVLELEDGDELISAAGPIGELQPPRENGITPLVYTRKVMGQPASDLIIEVRSNGTGARSFDAGPYMATQRRLSKAEVGEPRPRCQGGKWSFYVDTSASTADTFFARVPMLEAFLNETKAKTYAERADVFFFDLAVKEAVAATTQMHGLGTTVSEQLRTRLPLGLTRLDRALAHMSQQQADYVVLVSDVIATQGARGAALRSSLSALPVTTTLLVLHIGTKVDMHVAEEIAALGRGRVVGVPVTGDAEAGAVRMSEAWEELLAPLGAVGIVQAVDANTSSYPTYLSDLRPDSEVLYFSWDEAAGSLADGDTLKATAARYASLQIGGQTLAAPTSEGTVGGPFYHLVEREGVRAQLAAMELERQLAEQPPEQQTIGQSMVLLSRTQRVLCSLTALLVLETEADYDLYGIPRTRAKILDVTDAGVNAFRPGDPEYASFEYRDDDPYVGDEGITLEPHVDKSLAADMMGSASAAQRSAEARLPLLSVFGVAVIGKHCWIGGLLMLLATLQGCDNYSYYYYHYERSWLDLDQWAEETVQRVPADRNSLEAANYALAFHVRGEHVEVMNFTMSWLVWDPANPEVYERLGLAMHELGEAEDAVRALSSPAETHSSSPSQLLRAAWLLLSVNEADLAFDLAQRAFVEWQDNPDAHRAVALAHYALGAKADALRVYDEAQKCVAQASSSCCGCAIAIAEDTAEDTRPWSQVEEFHCLPTVSDDDSCVAYPQWERQTHIGSGQTGFLLSHTLHLEKTLMQGARGPQKGFVALISFINENSVVSLAVRRSTHTSDDQYDDHDLFYTDAWRSGSPRMIVMPQSGLFDIGACYEWNAGMGSARGTVTIWTAGSEQPHVIPFSLSNDKAWCIIRVAQVCASEDSARVLQPGDTCEVSRA